MVILRNSKVRLLAFILIFLPTLVYGQNKETVGPVNEKPEETITLASLIDSVEQYQQEKSDLQKRIANLLSAKVFEDELLELKIGLEETRGVLRSKKGLSSWGHIKIKDFLSRINPLQRSSDSLKSSYLTFLKQSELLLEELKKNRTYFKSSLQELKLDPLAEEQKPFIQTAIESLSQFIKQVENIREKNTKIYKTYNPVFIEIEKIYSELQSQQERFQDNLVEKTRPAIIEGRFWKSFDSKLWLEIRHSWASLSDINIQLVSEDLPRYGVVFLIFILTFFLLKRLNKTSDFSVNQFSLSIFVALVSSTFLIQNPIPIVKLICWLVMPFILFRIIKSYKLSSESSPYLLRLFVAYSLIRVVEIIDFPLTMYRMFIVALSLSIAFYAFLRYRKVSDWESQSGVKRFLFVATIALFSITAIAEIVGFHVFAVYMVHGIIQSVFLIFALFFSQVFVYQIISFILNLPLLGQIKIISRYKGIFLKQLCRAVKIAMFILGIFILPTIWGVYSDFFQSYESISSLGVTIGETLITLEMLLEAVVLFFIAYFIGFIICAILENEVYPRKQIERGTANSINSLINYALLIVGAFLAFFALGFELKQLALVAGALSVGIGFGLQNIVNNFVSGIILLFERPVKIGDLLEISDQWGEVEKMGLRSTTIRTFSKTQLIIPNSEFITQPVTNLTLSDTQYRVVIPVGIAYGSDTKKVEEILQSILDSHEKVLENPRPRVFFRGFGDSSLDFELYLWIPNVSDKKEITSDILFKIDQKFREHDVEIPFPQRDLHVRSVDAGLMKKVEQKAPDE